MCFLSVAVYIPSTDVETKSAVAVIGGENRICPEQSEGERRNAYEGISERYVFSFTLFSELLRGKQKRAKKNGRTLRESVSLRH